MSGPPYRFTAGDRVRIGCEPFAGHLAEVLEVRDSGRLVVVGELVSPHGVIYGRGGRCVYHYADVTYAPADELRVGLLYRVTGGHLRGTVGRLAALWDEPYLAELAYPDPRAGFSRAPAGLEVLADVHPWLLELLEDELERYTVSVGPVELASRCATPACQQTARLAVMAAAPGRSAVTFACRGHVLEAKSTALRMLVNAAAPASGRASRREL
jgi:hypothetical protein